MPAAKLGFMGIGGQSFSFFFCCQKKNKKLFASYTFSAEKVEVGGFAPPSEHPLLSGATSLASLV